MLPHSTSPSRAAADTDSLLSLSAELSASRATCSDVSRPLSERLEALEDVCESAIGDTPLLRARGLERRYGLRQLYLKIEGDNPTGTHKDRIAAAQVYDALRQGYTGLCFATCGNYGVAMAWATHIPALRCVAVVPEPYHAPRITQIERLGAEVVRAGDDYEGALVFAQKLATERELYDANPGGLNQEIQLAAYKTIASEIYDDLRDAPRAVGIPVSNGTTLAGIARGFHSLERRGRTSRMPRLFAGSAFRKNPIIHAFRRGLPQCEDLPASAIRETAVNEPLINWHASDGQAALDALRSSDGYAADISDKRMRELARAVRDNQGVHVQPASTAGLAALLAAHQQQPLPSDRYVAVLTGR